MLPLKISGGFCVRAFAISLPLLVIIPSQALAQNNSAAAPTPPAAGSSSQPSAGTVPKLAPDGFITEPRFLTNSIDLLIDKTGNGGSQSKSGFYPEVSNMITGSGWLSIGPGYRQFLGSHLFIDGSAAISWHFYKMGQARVELPFANDHLSIGAQAMWQDQTQVNYFGVGPDALESDQSQYRMQSTDVVGHVSGRPHDWLVIEGEFGWLPRPRVMSPGGTFRDDDFPATGVLFATDAGVSLSRQPNFLHGEGSIAADTRDYPGHPTSGGFYRAALVTYSDRDSGTFSFRQYEAEGTQFVPLAERRWVLAFRGWTVLSDVAPGRQVPFYLLPTIGGHNTLRDYESLQFHDRNLLLLNAESRWGLFTHVDGAVFFDAGNVAAGWRDLNVDKTSYGAGVRVHTDRTTIARLDVATGAQGWRVLFRTSDPLRLSRSKRRAGAVPFTP